MSDAIPDSILGGTLRAEESYRILFESNPVPMWVYDLASLDFLAVNEAAVRHYGYSREEFLAMSIRDIRPSEDLPALEREIAEGRPQGHAPGIWRHRKKDGLLIEAEVTSHPIPFGGRSAQLVLSTDVTERRWLERQLQQVQKMEAIGQLAGGIAHDFNNLLTAILGYSELLAERFADGTPERDETEEIRRAADRAAALTRQLLAFGRKQVLEPVNLSVNDLIGNLEKMLRRLIGEDVDLLTRLDSGVANVRADPGQLEQVIVNLTLNARDAMPRGGKLTIETSEADLDGTYASRHVVVRPGRYVLVSVSDTGVGMDAKTQARVFEPFFTTKDKGKGTGLGLATVYGIVKQSGGYVWVYSEPGRGSTLKVYLPRVEDGKTRRAAPVVAAPPARGTETILLVEDEDLVRALTRKILENLGYHVLEAADAPRALEHARAHPSKISMVLTDVVMPETHGPEIATQIRALRPEVRVLYMSGYTDEAIVRHGVLEPGTFFLQKPFTPFSLGKKVREVLSAVS